MIGIYVFVLSCYVGYHVIWGVTPALHTPLMAVTNAISAIVVVGAILVAGGSQGSAGTPGSESMWVSVIGFFAVFLASINIFGGFVVTNRMLAMFKKKK
jgi:NAD(P) transhydrogenase subunit alpha